jgi:D-alanyl-D-alanine carboxypeptidase (penicillin-binding protein 5/6)
MYGHHAHLLGLDEHPAELFVRAPRRRWLSVLAVLAATVIAVATAIHVLRPPQAGGMPWPTTGTAALRVGGTLHRGPASDRQVPIASVAKVMTAYVVLRDHPLRDGDDGPTIVVSSAEAAAYPHQRAQGESLVEVEAGERVTERDALEALLLPSADNMAWILARWDAGSQATFVNRMNVQAQRLGMRSTSYTDPSGLAADTVSTAYDQVRLGSAALKVSALAAIVAMSTARVPVAGLVHNYNTLLGQHGVIGLKTGSTSAAGGCLLFAARTPTGKLLVGAVLGQPGKGRAMITAALAASDRLVLAASG